MFELQEIVAVPEPWTVAGIIGWQVRLGEIVSVSATVSVNALSSLIVIIEVAGRRWSSWDLRHLMRNLVGLLRRM